MISMPNIQEKIKFQFVYPHWKSLRILLIHPFVSNVPFLFRKFLRCFQGIEEGCIGKKWVKVKLNCCRFLRMMSFLVNGLGVEGPTFTGFQFYKSRFCQHPFLQGSPFIRFCFARCQFRLQTMPLFSKPLEIISMINPKEVSNKKQHNQSMQLIFNNLKKLPVF